MHWASGWAAGTSTTAGPSSAGCSATARRRTAADIARAVRLSRLVSGAALLGAGGHAPRTLCAGGEKAGCAGAAEGTRTCSARRAADRTRHGRHARPPAAPALPPADVEALYQVVAGRRDIRNGFLPDPIADDVLTRVLTAAHQAPSVGLSQPWDFIVLRDRARPGAGARPGPPGSRRCSRPGCPAPRARAFRELKVEAILDTPVNVVVTCDPTRGGRHVLGRHAQPQVAAYSTACAVQNFWLAARAEGLGRGLGQLLRRAGAGRRARPARAPAGGRLPVRGARRGVPARAGTGAQRLGPAPAAGLGGARRAVGPPRPAGRAARQPARRHRRRDRAAGRRGRGAGPRAAGGADQAERLAGRAGAGVGAAGRAGRGVPAAAARARRGRRVRRRPRGARPGRHPVAAGGHRADGGQLPGLRGGGQRDRRPGRGRGLRGGRRGRRGPAGRPRAAAPQDPARHRGHDHRARP